MRTIDEGPYMSERVKAYGATLFTGVLLLVSACGASSPTKAVDPSAKNDAAAVQRVEDDPPGGRRDTKRSCRIGSIDPTLRRVDLNQLAKAPEQFVGTDLITEGGVLDMYEISALVDRDTRGTVFTTWDSRGIVPCRGKKVTAQGHFREARPGSRYQFVLDVEALTEVRP